MILSIDDPRRDLHYQRFENIVRVPRLYNKLNELQWRDHWNQTVIYTCNKKWKKKWENHLEFEIMV